jgi:predicted ATPase
MLDITVSNNRPMFKKLNLKNFRTHQDSTIECSDITLLIGSNNSGKSNFFTGLNFFSRLINYYNPQRDNYKNPLKRTHYYPHKHSLSKDGEPMSFSCTWELEGISIEYQIFLYPDQSDIDSILGKEKLTILTNKTVVDEFESGYSNKSYTLGLRSVLRNSTTVYNDQISKFFRDISSFCYFNLQPSFLKGEGIPNSEIDSNGTVFPPKDYIRNYRESNIYPYIPNELGKEGGNLQHILTFIKECDEESYNRFFGYLKRFVKNFNGLILKENGLKWQFDMGGSNFPFYEPEKISDGIVKAAAVALLCSLRRPPALIMIEEVENGINQKKLSEFLSWLTSASDGGKKTQFILSSHSPSVIREFSYNLDVVYNIHLREKDFVSRLTNLNEALKPLVNMGAIKEESTITKNGVDIIQIRPYDLVELFYNGVLGEL